MEKIGYARVSTYGQSLEVQIKALEAAGCTVIFSEKKSGKDTNREELNRMLEYAREGDTVVVYKLDRLGRSLRDIISLIEQFQKNKILFVSLTDNIDLSTSGGKFQFHVFSAFAELERNIIAERCTAGRMEAKNRGVKFGPKNRELIVTKAKETFRLYSLGLKIKEIQKIMGIKSNKTVYTYIKLVSKLQ